MCFFTSPTRLNNLEGEVRIGEKWKPICQISEYEGKITTRRVKVEDERASHIL